MQQLHNELKKEFQLERMILFSDAVFAIAITLLVIEIKVPELHGELTDAAMGNELLHLIPKFVGFLISFFIIGLYWILHHQLFGFVINYDRKLLWLNLGFLMSIVLMPFSSGLYGEYAGRSGLGMHLPYGIYTGNVVFSGLMLAFLWRHLGNPKKRLAEGFPDEQFVRAAKLRSLVVPGLFALSFFVTLSYPIAGRYVPMFIPLVLRFIKRKKQPES